MVRNIMWTNPPQNINVQWSEPSKVDLLSGRHTTPIIVALLFLITLIIFACMVIFKEPLNDTIVTWMLSLLSGLVGFFAWSSFTKND